MARPAGYGQEAYGDPFGAGGPLHVVAARAVKGQVIRVVFDELPVAASPSGTTDALNPSNYVISIVNGTATEPVVIGVDPVVLAAPSVAVPPGDFRAVDIHTDRALVAGITYRVTVRRVRSSFGGVLGAPYAANFVGVVPVTVTRPTLIRTDNTDIANNPFVGTYVVDPSGDLSPDSGVETVKKRIFRRLMTPKGSFVWMPSYGVGLRLKNNMNVSQLQGLKADILAQVKREPEVIDASVGLTLDPTGLLTIALKAKTIGDTIPITLSAGPGGT